MLLHGIGGDRQDQPRRRVVDQLGAEAGLVVPVSGHHDRTGRPDPRSDPPAPARPVPARRAAETGPAATGRSHADATRAALGDRLALIAEIVLPEAADPAAAGQRRRPADPDRRRPGSWPTRGSRHSWPPGVQARRTPAASSPAATRSACPGAPTDGSPPITSGRCRRPRPANCCGGCPPSTHWPTPTSSRAYTDVGGHPRSLEYLDALLAAAARFDDIAERLDAALPRGIADPEPGWRVEGTWTGRWPRPSRWPPTTSCSTTCSTGSSGPGARRLLLGAAVYRNPSTTPAWPGRLADITTPAPDPDRGIQQRPTRRQIARARGGLSRTRGRAPARAPGRSRAMHEDCLEPRRPPPRTTTSPRAP